MKKDFIPATKDMLQQAADGELVLFAPARRHTAKLRAFTWAVAPKQSNRSCAAGLVPITPQLAEELLCFPDAQLKSYLAVDPTDCPPSRPWKDHYWVLDEPQTITREQIQGVIPTDAPADDADHTETLAARSITKQQVIDAFGGLHFNDRAGWRNALSDVPQWIEPCRVTLGRKGDNSTSATWNPVLIAAALIDKGSTVKQLDPVFLRSLQDWVSEWEEASAYYR